MLSQMDVACRKLVVIRQVGGSNVAGSKSLGVMGLRCAMPSSLAKCTSFVEDRCPAFGCLMSRSLESSGEDVSRSGDSHSIESRNAQWFSTVVQVDGAQVTVAEAGRGCSTGRRCQLQGPKGTTEC